MLFRSAVASLASVGHIGNDMGGEAEVEVEMSELTKVPTSVAVESGSPAIGQDIGMEGISASQSSFSKSYNITGASKKTQSSSLSLPNKGGSEVAEVILKSPTKMVNSPAIELAERAIGQGTDMDHACASQISFSESYTVMGASRNSQSS